jgi:16S rRNA (guanine527-N7)-methyltransferase
MSNLDENIDYTPEVEPKEAKEVYGEYITQARQYFDLLVRDGDLLGLIGPRELPKLWSRHILNSAVVADLVEDGQLVADVGSGAGFPGIPMAILRPKVKFVLIEPMERRANWLADVVVPTLGLENVQVLRGRAEEAPLRNYDVTTARAVSALPKLLRMLVPLTVPGGQILAMKGSKAQDEIDQSKSLAKKLKLDTFEIVTVGENLLVDPTTVVRVRLL